MRVLAWSMVAVLLLLAAAADAGTDGGWVRKTVSAPGKLQALRRLGNGIYLDVRPDPAAKDAARYHRLFLTATGIVLEAMPYFLVAPEERRADMLPDGLIFRGGRNIRETWLSGPTTRYRHGVLGDAIEATTLKAVDDSGEVASFELDADSVFEDIYPRLADVDGDGQDEILVVHSYLDRGAALAVFELEKGSLRLAAESPPLGAPRRWLNPIGVGDLDGDGRPEIAVVATPHLDGDLRIYELRQAGLVLEGEKAGFSNHVKGSRELAMSLLIDLDGDGLLEIVVPSGDRRSLRILSFADGRLRTLASIENEHAIDSALYGLDLDGDKRPELVYALDDGTVVVLTH